MPDPECARRAKSAPLRVVEGDPGVDALVEIPSVRELLQVDALVPRATTRAAR